MKIGLFLAVLFKTRAPLEAPNHQKGSTSSVTFWK